MRKIDRLKKEALESCKFRGHDMRRFTYLDYHRSISSCKVCNMVVCVDIKPLPNSIDISGEAVALTCFTKEQKLIGDLWYAIVNGEVGEDFFNLRSRVRKALHKYVI